MTILVVILIGPIKWQRTEYIPAIPVRRASCPAGRSSLGVNSTNGPSIRKYIAKFSSTSAIYNVVKSEFVAMRLAELVGLNVAPVALTTSSHKDVLLIERFDRIDGAEGWRRKAMVSSLTLFGLDELMAR